ncbi:MAG: hypothetical protein Q9160_008188 [Pyrenula sp. 1 TL-2023]
MSDLSAWKGANNAINRPLAKLATQCDEECDWSTAAELASSLRAGIPCSVLDGFSMGTRKIAKKIEFADGIIWIIAVWMRIDVHCKRSFENEVATCEFLSENTKLPVPNIYAADWNADKIGRPYLIQKFLPGTRADQYRFGGEFHPGESHQWQNLMRQMAHVMVVMGNLKFNKIGSLIRNPTTKEFYIGEELFTREGPFSTAQHYYDELSRSYFYFRTRKIESNLSLAKMNLWGGFTLPFVFSGFMPQIADSETDYGPFGLANGDFGLHNILIDDKFNITGIIDLDGVVASPPACVAQYPVRTPFDCLTPSGKWQDPCNFAEIFCRRHAETFREYVRQEEETLHGDGNHCEIADALGSDAARMVECLRLYGSRDPRLDEEQMAAMWFMIAKTYNKSKSLEWEHPREPEKDEASHANQFDDSNGAWGAFESSANTVDVTAESWKSNNSHPSGLGFGTDGANDSSPNEPGNWESSPATGIFGSWILEGAEAPSWDTPRPHWRHSDDRNERNHTPPSPASPGLSKGGMARKAARTFKSLAVKFLRSKPSPSESVKL